jgi:hypothetical protein
MKISHELIPYEQALELKELGFDGREECLAYYNTNPRYTKPSLDMVKPMDHEFCLPAPLYQQAFRWFREKHGLYADLFVDDDQTFGFCVSSFAEEGRCRLDKPIKRQFGTYEESELECIKFLIEIVERKPEAYS